MRTDEKWMLSAVITLVFAALAFITAMLFGDGSNGMKLFRAICLVLAAFGTVQMIIAVFSFPKKL